MAMSQQELVDTLSGLALFADLSRPQVEAVAHQMAEESYPTGQRILRQGFTGTGFYVIVDGEVAIKVDGDEIARLGKGDFFGELSVVDQQPRNASVQAIADTRCLSLASWELLQLLQTDPALSLNLIRGLVTRIRENGEHHRH